MPDPERIRVIVAIIQGVAGVVGFTCLRHARKILPEEKNSFKSCIFIFVVVTITISFALLSGRYEVDPHLVVDIAAFCDLVLLAALVFWSGGPTQSWFTPYLLAVLPLMILLNESNPTHLWVALCVTFAIFFWFLFFKMPPELRVSPGNKRVYHGWYMGTTTLSVFLPTAVKLKLLMKVSALLALLNTLLNGN